MLVSDIGLLDPSTQQTLTLDGIFGMNFMVASTQIFLDPNGGFPSFGDMAAGAFNWIVFDEPNGLLGLDVKPESVPEPATIVLLAIGTMMLVWRRRQIGRALRS